MMPIRPINLGDAGPGKPVFVCATDFLDSVPFGSTTYIRHPGILIAGMPCISSMHGKTFISPTDPLGWLVTIK